MGLTIGQKAYVFCTEVKSLGDEFDRAWDIIMDGLNISILDHRQGEAPHSDAQCQLCAWRRSAVRVMRLDGAFPKIAAAAGQHVENGE